MARLLDAGGWLGLSAGGWLMLSQLWWPLCMLVQKGCWLASMLCLGSDTLELRRSRRTGLSTGFLAGVEASRGFLAGPRRS